MKTIFKKGDTVKCIDIDGIKRLTLEKIYTIVNEDHKLSWGNNIIFVGVVDDVGKVGKYNRGRFFLTKTTHFKEELFTL